MGHSYGLLLVEIMACWIFGNKQYPEQVLTQQSHPKEGTSMEIIETNKFSLTKWHLKLQSAILLPGCSGNKLNFLKSLRPGDPYIHK